MLKRHLKVIQYVVLAALMLTPSITLLPALPVSADGGIGVSPSIVSDFVISGSSKTYNITLNSGFVLDAEVDGLGQTPAGATIAVPAQQDGSPLSARSWISLKSSHFDAGSSQTLTVCVNVPANTTPGEHYAAIYLHGGPSGQGSLDIVSGMIIPVILTVDANSFISSPSGQISGLNLGALIKGRPVNLAFSFNNTGNCLVGNAGYDITLKDSSNHVIWQYRTSFFAPSIIPGCPRQISVSYEPGLGDGNYSLTVNVTVPGTTLDSKTVSFSIGESATVDSGVGHVCNIGDVVTVGLHWGETGAPGWIPQDWNKDGVININDVVVIGLHWGKPVS